MRLRQLLVPLALLVTAAFATTIVPASIEKLTTESTDVVEARAIDSRSAWNSEHTLIYTYTRFEVRNALKGTAPNVITVKQMGGHADGYTQRVSGVQYWEPGEEAVLFLRPSISNDNTLAITGFIQGAYRMKRQPSGEIAVTNSVPDVRAFDTRSGAVANYRGTRMTLQQLETRVRKAVEQ